MKRIIRQTRFMGFECQKLRCLSFVFNSVSFPSNSATIFSYVSWFIWWFIKASFRRIFFSSRASISWIFLIKHQKCNNLLCSCNIKKKLVFTFIRKYIQYVKLIIKVSQKNWIMDYRITEQIEEVVTPPFSVLKFSHAILLLVENIESIDTQNALDNFMNIHVLSSWLSDHIEQVNAIPATVEAIKPLISRFGRLKGLESEFNSNHSNHNSRPDTIVTTDEIFVGGTSMAAIYALNEDDQDPYVEQILDMIKQYQGKPLWYSGAMHMMPPHHCEWTLLCKKGMKWSISYLFIFPCFLNVGYII